jgi:hypothetical protein
LGQRDALGESCGAKHDYREHQYELLHRILRSKNVMISGPLTEGEMK